MAERSRLDTRRLLDAAFRIWSERGAGEGMLERIARAAKADPERILYWYDDLETLFRLAVDSRVKALLAPLESCCAPAAPVREVVRNYAEACVELLASDDYRRLCYVVIRDGTLYPWLIRKHDAVLLGTMQSLLGRLVRRAVEKPGIALDIRASGTRAFVSDLQRELALPMLLPKRKEPTRLEMRLLVARATEQAMRSVYPAGTIVESLVLAATA
jgi:AcrR family transcriptional regulator